MQYADRWRLSFLGKRTLPVPSLILFLRQWSVLAASTLPMNSVLRIISESGANRGVRKTAVELHERTAAGALISQAMRASGLFSSVLIAMVQTGEESGTLAEILENYTAALERQETTRRKIQQALIYPILLSVVSVAVVSFLLVYVIPSFITLFSDAGMNLPAPTRILLSISRGINTYGSVLLIAVAAGLILLILLSRTEKGKFALHRIRRRIPFLGNLSRDIRTARLAELMALFFQSNVDLVRFLEIITDGSGSPAERKALQAVHTGILEGMPVSDAFGAVGYYNPVFIGMLRTGEETGRLSEVTRSIASYLDLEVQLRLTRATALLEPVLILILSFLVGFIVLAIAMPMFQMVNLYEI